MNLLFLPKVKTVGKIDRRFTTSEIAGEQMVYSGDWGYTMANGGPITRLIMETLQLTPEWRDAVGVGLRNGRNIVIDTRTNMLMAGMYPSIPGWHCDDVPRGEKYAQPDVRKVSDDVQHFMVILSDSDECPARTEFVTEQVIIDVDPENVWNSVDAAVEREKFHTAFLNEGEIIRFNQTAIHRATLCQTPGWRLFFRLSITHRKPVNEIRKQVQVYTTSNGW